MIRHKSDTIPIIIISCLWHIDWLEKGFLIWVNDYLVKPFRLRELELRVNRWFRTFLYNKLKTKKELVYYSLRKDLFSWDFYYKDKKINLTKNSKFILTLFLQSPETLITDRFLIDKIWWDVSSVIERNPRVNITRLKKSLVEFWIDYWVHNVRGEGYILKKLD